MIRTFTGVDFYPVAPRVEDIRIEDIAHALANACRFTGHVQRFFSVAQHSVHVAEYVIPRIVPPRVVLAALLHDAAEAYLVDVPKPLKVLPAFRGYRKIERRLQELIFRKFGCAPTRNERDRIKAADHAMFVVEARTWMPGFPGIDARGSRLPEAWLPARAEQEFLAMFRDIVDRGQKGTA